MRTLVSIQKIAKLVKLDISGEEEKLAAMFTETLDYISVLNELDTSNVTTLSVFTYKWYSRSE